jgi:hypothetical protein
MEDNHGPYLMLGKYSHKERLLIVTVKSLFVIFAVKPIA